MFFGSIVIWLLFFSSNNKTNFNPDYEIEGSEFLQINYSEDPSDDSKRDSEDWNDMITILLSTKEDDYS